MYLLLDTGGTKTRLALSPDGQSLGEVKIIPTDPNFANHLVYLKKAARTPTSDPIQGIVCGLPGVIDAGQKTLSRAPHLPRWAGQPIQQALAQTFACPALLANDADLAGLGEATSGAGQGYDIVAYLTISTGVGGARIVNQKIDLSAQGFEPGYQIVTAQDGKNITLEDCVSGSGLANRHGLPAEQISDPAIWDETMRLLAIGLHNVAVHWSPHCIVLGGAVMQSIDLSKLKKQLAQTLTIFPVLPEIKLASLGETSALHGALLYLRDASK